MKTLIALFALFFSFEALAGTTSVITMNERNYRLYVPDSVQSPAPLVVVFHPALSNAQTFQEDASQLNGTLDAEADAGEFMVAYVNGTARVVPFNTWNAGWCCAFAHEINSKDVDIVRRVILHISQTQDIDETKVYLAGFSNGAMMAYSLLCRHPTEFAGIVVAAGALTEDEDSCAAVIDKAITHVHGEDDINVPLAGGSGLDFDDHYVPFLETKLFLQSRRATVNLILLKNTDHTFTNIEAGLASQESSSFAELIGDMVAQ
jgi:polyhydroxybutyrate depolymerase